MKARIVKRIDVDGSIYYVIQQYYYFLFKSWWEDVWICNTIEEAKNNLCYFDESKIIDEVINP